MRSSRAACMSSWVRSGGTQAGGVRFHELVVWPLTDGYCELVSRFCAAAHFCSWTSAGKPWAGRLLSRTFVTYHSGRPRNSSKPQGWLVGGHMRSGEAAGKSSLLQCSSTHIVAAGGNITSMCMWGSRQQRPFADGLAVPSPATVHLPEPAGCCACGAGADAGAHDLYSEWPCAGWRPVSGAPGMVPCMAGIGQSSLLWLRARRQF
jgi:hypothetical protein